MDECWKAIEDVLEGGWVLIAGPRRLLDGIGDNGDAYPPGVFQVAAGFERTRAEFAVTMHNAVVTGEVHPTVEMMQTWCP